ncbi:uncharacterized protein LOC127570086 [Pristis pectinata]|uniref:uncharacterized protein LOC127570086 n=1 Tax=Pristis pectinata TaxID=685728 RepID=UPI00223CC7BE|nr:uncharacterized protein LOC127570086 [Pristis pectinata]
MRLRFLCSSLPAGLMFAFLVLLLRPVSTRENRDHIYFLDKGEEVVLEGPVNPGNGPVVWEWKPHSGQDIQQLGTFSRWGRGWWREQWNNDWRRSVWYQELRVDGGTVNLRIKKPNFKIAGLFTLTQTQPTKQILKQYEIFGIKVEASPQWSVVGSDVTLSCTISRLPDTVSLQWERKDSSQQNRRGTVQIRLNNTVYLMVQQLTVEDGKLYVCQVRENGDIVRTTEADFTVVTSLYGKCYTVYRSSTDHSELHLVCYYDGYDFFHAAWTWRSRQHQDQEKEIASATKSQPISVKRADFGNRLVTSVNHFNGKNLSMRIVPVLFEDAGVYKCSLGPYTFLTIDLITVKVTAEPADAVTEGDTVTLTCSVSDVTEPMRLVWINGDGKTVGEKSLNGEEKSLSLIVQKADRGGRNWRCGLFQQNMLRIVVPYYQEPSGRGTSVYFVHEEGNFVLKGPDNPGNGSIDLEWRPHTGQQTAKRLGTFHREDQRWAVQWSDEYNKMPGFSQRMHADWGTLNVRISKPTFELAGLFTWNQTQLTGKILRQWEVFGIKVEVDSQRPVVGSDITLSCNISRLPDTVSLHWKPRGSSQQNRSNNTDQIHLNNTVYLMVQHVGAGNPNLYKWEVQENGSTVLTGDKSVEVDQDLHSKTYTVYRSDTDHSELDLICEASAEVTEAKWTWRSQRFQNQEREIASTHRSELINVNKSYFDNRLGSTVGNVNGRNFSVRIVPVRFEDAGVYTCSTGSYKHVTIELITVRVTAKPSDAVTEGGNVTLTCSVSDVTESMRLVWINGAGKTVEEKVFMERKNKGDSWQLILLKADEGQRKWTCGLFHQNRPKIFIPYYLQVNKDYSFKHTSVVITGVALLLIIILVTVLCLRKCKFTGLENRQEPPQTKSNTEDESHLYANPDEIQQVQGINETSMPETNHIAEHMSVNKKARQEDTEEDIHYGSISFQENAPGHRHGTLSSNRASDTNPTSSWEDDSIVIYAQITKTNK